MRLLLWLIVLLLPLAAAQNDTADGNVTGPDPDVAEDDNATLQLMTGALAGVLMGAFVYVARR